MKEKINEVSTLAVYSDYGDMSGTQTLRRLIAHINKHFISVNASTNEIIRVVNKLTEIVESGSSASVEELIAQVADILLELEKKATKTEVTSGLALKADKTALTSGLGLKADKTELTTGLGLKADKTALTSGLALKADKTELTPIKASITGLETDVLDIGTNVEHFDTTFSGLASDISLFNTEMDAIIDGTLNDSYVALEAMVAQLKLIKPTQP